MPNWDSSLYLQFARERTQPAKDLATRIELTSPRHVIDLGCGPGNSTAVLAERWPRAHLEGLDTSPEMLAAARRDHPNVTWKQGDISTWNPESAYDVVFSNAALQWVPDHANVIAQLAAGVAPEGALAFQVPINFDAPAHRTMRELAKSPRWQTRFAAWPREWRVESPGFYYDHLAARFRRVEVWTTEYLHVLPNVDAIVAWYRGTGLRPWLEALPNETERETFLADYTRGLSAVYSPQHDGHVLFPFQRLFVIAYR